MAHEQPHREQSAQAVAPEHADVVVVGSGFGGSVSAYRMADAGRSVVVLERGKPYPPGSFARTPAVTARNFWDPSQGLQGLFDIWSFRGLEGVVSSGLGGGSLIYANVLLRKDEHWFVHESPIPGGGYENWPFSRQDLDLHYDKVETMIGTARYPYNNTARTMAMEESAQALGLDYQRPPLAVSFADANGIVGERLPLTAPKYGNYHGLPRQTCTLCGECDIGCNTGAKNTLDHNYLSAARFRGADIRTLSEVRGFSPLRGGGYEVRYVIHDPANEGRNTPTAGLKVHTITCGKLILAAGTFGSTYLLLRNRAAFPGISRALGTRFSGNGDLLTFLFGATRNGDSRPVQASHGPVITSAIRVGDKVDGGGATGRGHYIEDAGYPLFVDWLVEASQVPGAARRAARFALTLLRENLTGGSTSAISARISRLLGDGALSNSSLPLLGMGRDIADGTMHLKRGMLAVDWTTTTSRDYFDGVRQNMRRIADELGATFHDNPLWLKKRVVTVHPLGGAPIGRHVGEGVCDPYGEVFGYPGLYVLDGAAMPGPVGANPSLTIAALANRACETILSQPMNPAPRRPGTDPTSNDPTPTDPTSAPVPAAQPAPEGATSLSFTEQMKGYLALGVSDYQQGKADGRSLGQRLMFELTITAPDVEQFVADPAHEGFAVGYIDSDLLGGHCPVERGVFNLFVADDEPDTRRMLYRLYFADGGGNPLTLTGFKFVHDDPGFDTWSDTSTLYVRLLAGHVEPAADDAAQILGAGILTIHVKDFVHQLTTFRTKGPDPAAALQKFGKLFLGQLWQVFGEDLS
jgi:cholesterol oxidase